MHRQSKDSITLKWAGIEEGEAIMYYTLFWDKGTREKVEHKLVDYMLTEYDVKNLTVGTPYKFKIRAENVCSSGTFSEISTIHTCELN